MPIRLHAPNALISLCALLMACSSSESQPTSTKAPPGTCTDGESKAFYDLPVASNCEAHLLTRSCEAGAWQGDGAFHFEQCAAQTSQSYVTSFESLTDFEGFYILPPDHRGTTSHELSAEQVHSGSLAHKAWIYAANEVISGENTNHRGYPTIQLSRTDGIYLGKVVVEMWVWLDIALSDTAGKDWFSFASFTGYDDDQWQRVYLVNLSPQGFVHLGHVPTMRQQIHDIYQTETIKFPQKQWVKLSILIDHTSDNLYESPFMRVWQDDVLVSSARFTPRLTEADIALVADTPCAKDWDGEAIEALEQSCGLRYAGDGLAQAHFGMYAPPSFSEGVVYNDDLAIYQVDAR